MLNKLIKYCLDNKFVVLCLLLIIILLGVYVAPFDWNIGIERKPVAVDAIPDIGENQQIVFTEWKGRSPRDIEDQITYPLVTNLMGLPGIKTVRGSSMFGFSVIYIIFEDDVDFYWSRTRILEKLNSLPTNLLPAGVNPKLGPDATALGQVFWYTLEGIDKKGNPTGGWDLDELRSIQDWIVRYALLSTEGVSEVASVGGYVKEYQIDLNPDAMRAYDISLKDVYSAVKNANKDIGINTLEVNGAEYLIRGLGYIESIQDIENSVVCEVDHTPVYIKNIAEVHLGPAYRRGILNKEGAEVVGGVVIVRYGENPLRVINRLKEKIKEVSPSLPKKTLSDGTVSQVKIVPFYDRSGLIYETLGTLNSALFEEILVAVIVILLMIRQLKIAGLISALLPVSVLFAFILMKIFNVDANIVALSGIAIAIGTVVDMGIVICENIVKHMKNAPEEKSFSRIIYEASSEVSSAILTSVTTTIISFLPVFMLQYAEGKLFRPLAFTKTFTLAAACFISLFIIPPAAHILFKYIKFKKSGIIKVCYYILLIFIAVLAWSFSSIISILLLLVILFDILLKFAPERIKSLIRRLNYLIIPAIVMVILAFHWHPVGYDRSFAVNMLFAVIPIAFFLFLYYLFEKGYTGMLNFCLKHKKIFSIIPLCIVLLGLLSWFGIKPLFSVFPKQVGESGFAADMDKLFPGLGEEFMPSLDEGSFLLMPSLMPNASIGEVNKILTKQDILINRIPEITDCVGKAGRADTALDPAPLSMIETIINYKQKYLSNKNGRYLRFKYEPNQKDYFRNADGKKITAPDGKPYIVKGKFIRDKNGNLIPDGGGNVFRQWRPELLPALNPGRKYWHGINSPDDIWEEIVKAANMPGVTSSPKLQPIETRIVMLQSGMRAPLGVVIKGMNLKDIEKAAYEIEKVLKKVPSIRAKTVFANRIIGKPYLEIDVKRDTIARYGLKLEYVLDEIEAAIGGKVVTTTVEGRERYPVRIRYMRELRDNIEALRKVLITTSDNQHIPLGQLAEFKFRRGPQNITSEDGFLVNYVFFDKKEKHAEVNVVEHAKTAIKRALEKGTVTLPQKVTYRFAGNYENQIRAAKRLLIIIPFVLVLIFIILYFQFKSVTVSTFVFSGIALAWCGGFIMLWLYGQPWFMNFSILGVNLRELFHMQTINLSVAVWVGFLALFGIATDNGVILATYVKETFIAKTPQNIEGVHENIMHAGNRRIKACLMTTATTVLALIPILSSVGRGSDVMVPMAVPVFGGMIFQIITTLMVPVLYSFREERKIRKKSRKPQSS
ncbi:MAG: efflux RND transporter permease subunit [Victivallales bacterium]|nr:efflux RND transporter permease subunit [Victivallales bacterium]